MRPAIILVLATVAVAPSPSLAGGLAKMSCGELWIARNAIYARGDNCQQTLRGRAAPGCRLRSRAGDLVAEIKAWERRRGC